MMLVHLEQSDIAELVHNAWLRTVEDGIHTYDIFSKEHSSQQVGTKEFGDAVGERIGQHPKKLPAVTYSAASAAPVVSRQLSDRSIVNKQLAGLDMFVDWKEGSPEELANLVQQVNGEGLVLEMIDSRGVKVWPDGFPETKLGDHWRCRFVPEESGQTITHLQIASLLSRAAGVGIDFIKTENLCTFDGESGFSLSQGE